MKRKRLLSNLLVAIISVAFFKFFFVFFVGTGNKNKYVPHIDTEFSKDFQLQNWRNVRVGDTITMVHTLLGKPLMNSYEHISSRRPRQCYYEEQYSRDGKWGYADFAWQSFSAYYDKNFHVMALDSTWYYD